MNKDVYFANLPDHELCEAAMEKVDQYFDFLSRSTLAQTWANSFKAYYNSEIVGGQITKTGQQNEYRNLNVNHYRSVLTNLKSMIAQQMLAYDAKATNTDVKSAEQTILANSLLEYYPKEKNLNECIDEALESAIVLSEGWIATTWDVQSGEVYGYHEETQAPIYEGDIKYSFYLPPQVIRDVTKRKFRDNIWFMTIDFVNKWDLMAQYPEHALKIKDTSPDSKVYNRYTLYGRYAFENTDDIPIITLYHKKTPAVPNGKLAIILDEETTLYSGALPYRRLPLRRLTTSTHLDWNFGYTLAYDLLPIQNGLNILDSVIITNQSTYGVQNIIAARGSNVQAAQLAGGLNLIEWDYFEGATEPHALNLTSTPAEIFNYRTTLVNDIQLISGVNAVARGDMNVLGKNMSGSAMALIQTMAIQYANSLQKSYIATLEGVGTDTIHVLRDYAKVPKIALIVGKANEEYMRSFTGDDLSEINRVTIDVGNPMSKTVAGRTDLADKYLEHGFVKAPEQYEQVMSTGKLEPMIEGDRAQLIQIRQENEDLAAGKPAMAVVTDNHVLHIVEHGIPISGDGRWDAARVERVSAHIQEHIDILENTNPLLLSILKQPVPPPMMPPAGGLPPPPMGGSPAGPGPSGQEVAGINPPNLPESPIQQ